MSMLFVVIIAAILPVFFAIHSFFSWVAEGDPFMRALNAEATRDQIERPQSWRG